MKKLAILFLLTLMVGAFAFAIDGVGDFQAYLKADLLNVNEGNDGDMGLKIKPGITFSRDIIDNLNLYVEVGVPILKDPMDGDDTFVGVNEFDLNLTYGGIAAGPGTVSVYVKNAFIFDEINNDNAGEEVGDTWQYTVTPGVAYALGAGPGTLTFDLGSELGVIRAGGDGDFEGKAYLGITYAIPAYGVRFTAKPYFLYAPDTAFGGVYFYAAYANANFGIGVESDRMSADKDVDFGDVIPIDPFAEAYLLGGSLIVGAHCLISIEDANDDVEISPGVYVKYNF
jgi:hypothetical protein